MTRCADLRARIHINIGDTQCKPNTPTAHLTWIGRYVVDQFAGQDVCINHVGDHWDMESLSSYDRGKKAMEGRRYKADIKAGNHGWDLLCEPLEFYNETRRGRSYRWHPDLNLFLGNHEYRIVLAGEDNAQLDGLVTLDDLNAKEHGWEVHAFREVVDIDGISYSHYFYNPNTGKPYAGENMVARLKTIGRSFTMGHQQGLLYGLRAVGKTRHHGLVIGSSYLHDENYMGPQGNAYWRGIVVCHQVENGAYDPMFVSLEYLCRRYEKMTLADFMKKTA